MLQVEKHIIWPAVASIRLCNYNSLMLALYLTLESKVIYPDAHLLNVSLMSDLPFQKSAFKNDHYLVILTLNKMVPKMGGNVTQFC